MSADFPTTNPSWDLDSFFEGGIESPKFFAELEALESQLEDLRATLKALSPAFSGDRAVRTKWRELVDDYFEVAARLSEAGSYAYGMARTHTDVAEALRLPAALDGAQTAMKALRVELQAKFRGLVDEQFEALLQDERFHDCDLWLSELRRDARQAMDPALEALAVDLNRDGLHAWGRLYDQTTARLTVEVEIDGDLKTMSLGQAKNLHEHPSREVRRAADEGLERAWRSIAPICAYTLNSKVGAEKTLYKRRGGDCLTRPLQRNRVERESVEAIMEAAAELRPLLVRYLNAKARLLGTEKLAWYDRGAPVGEKVEEKISYEEAQRFIVEQVAQFSPDIAEFCRMALSRQWVEVEDRPGKGQGGYCTSLPVSKEIRIFMTFGGTNSGVATLAHELGHGYHYWAMRDLPLSQMDVPMGLAETASTLLEALVEQAALKRADDAQRLGLLEERLRRASVFLMDIPARYALEKAMHAHREKGVLHEELLCELAREAFETSFGGGVASVDELFWASKLHFFITEYPFYNFPYAFGYLFSRAVYDRAMQEGASFVNRIDDLLRDTGRMSSEQLAEKYLDADLRESSFWKSAAGSLEEDVALFEEMVRLKVGQ